MQYSDHKANPYLGNQFYGIQGFCSMMDARLFHFVMQEQAASGTTGSLIEIGVWHGKSFFIFATGRSVAEKVVAIDLFETRPLRQGEKQQVDAFTANCGTVGVPLDSIEILKGDSCEITPDDVLPRAGRARIVHVDGGHDYQHALHDIQLAESVLLEDGVMIVDDTFNRQWPEVTAAMYDWIRQATDFVPWAVTKQKLYLCRQGYKARYESALVRDFPKEIGRFSELFGARHMMVDPLLQDEILDRVKSKLLMPRQVKMPKATEVQLPA